MKVFDDQVSNIRIKLDNEILDKLANIFNNKTYYNGIIDTNIETMNYYEKSVKE